MVKEQNQNVDKYDIPVWRKYTLSVQEAAKYFHIGDKKLRRLIDENPDCRVSSSGTDRDLRSSAGCLNNMWMRNCLPYRNGQDAIDSEPGL